MRIGIDLGGSHVAVGLIEEGRIIEKREKNFLDEEREKIEEIIENTILSNIKGLLKSSNLTLKEIERIGIAAPRLNSRWSNC